MSDATTIETVDLVVLTADRDHFKALLIRRGKRPYAGQLALPGGRVERNDKTLQNAAARELRKETGISIADSTLELIGRYNVPERDPRGDTASTAFLSVFAEPVDAYAGDDATSAEWVPLHDALAETLAFDHDLILRDGLALSERLGHAAALRRQMT